MTFISIMCLEYSIAHKWSEHYHLFGQLSNTVVNLSDSTSNIFISSIVHRLKGFEVVPMSAQL